MLTKKKIIVIIIFILIIACSLFTLTIKNNFPTSDNYKITLTKLDEYSPDRKLEVYKNDKLIEYDRIYYKLAKKEEVILCYGNTPYVSYLDFLEVNNLVIVLKNGERIPIEYIKEE